MGFTVFPIVFFLSKLQAPSSMKTVLQALNVVMQGLGNIITMIVVKAKIFDDQVDICEKIALLKDYI